MKDAFKDISPEAGFLSSLLDGLPAEERAMYWRARILDSLRKLEEYIQHLKELEPPPTRDILAVEFAKTKLSIELLKEENRMMLANKSKKMEATVFEIIEKETDDGEEDDEGDELDDS